MIRKTAFVGMSAAILLSTGYKGFSAERTVGPDLRVEMAALTGFFPHNISATEAALALLKLDPRYTIQKTKWFFRDKPKKVFRSNPLANSRIDYAHAAGLTGAGQTIAFLDDGFLSSHIEFTGKKIWKPSGANAPRATNHGTSVASIAAGTGAVGDMIGVAPRADLQFGSYDTLASMTAATVQARNVGAIVQNNSWGYDMSYSQANFSRQFGSPQGNAYIAALRNLAKDSVIVFAASNEKRKKADLTSALPAILPELEASWITAINAIPKVRGNTIKSAKLLSNRCLQAAAWCIAADGTWTAATARGNSDYALTTGTSMSTPMVSGSIALLAEAFPRLSAQELRARLLASANNKFYKHSGYVAFAPGVKHGYNRKYGHGFLDMRAALMPIGGSFMPRSRGKSLRVDRPILLTGGMAGNALTRRLADHDIDITDGLGAGFEMPASFLTATAIRDSGQDSALALLTGLAEDPMALAFPSYVSGQRIGLESGDIRIAMLVPDNATGNDFGISVMQMLGEDLPGVSVGLTAMHESDSFVGMQSLVSDNSLGGTHLAAVLGLDIPFSARHGLRLTGTFGVAVPDGDIPAMEMSSVNFNAIGMTYGVSDLLAAGDRLVLGVKLPQVVQSGVAKVALPSVRSNGATRFNTVDLSLEPTARQLDLSLSYSVPISRRSEVTFSAAHILNDGHDAARNATGAGVGFRMQF